MKKNNPYIPIMVREASGTEPRVWARYEFGREKMEDLRGTRKAQNAESRHLCIKTVLMKYSGLDDKAIEERVTNLVKEGQ